MKKIEQFQITGMTISGFRSYEEPTELSFGNPTVITGGNGRGKTSIADAIAFAVTGLPFFGERGIDKLHNEVNGELFISLRFIDGDGQAHELTRIRRNSRMTIIYDGYEIRQLDLGDMFGERDVFLSIFNPLYFIEELSDEGKHLLERYLPSIPYADVLAQLSDATREALQNEEILSPDSYLKKRREEIRELKEQIIYINGQKDLAAAQKQDRIHSAQENTQRLAALKEELAALQDKQFVDMDIPAMRERLVDLSGRYEETARDGRSSDENHIKLLQSLREKIVQRQSEKYESKYLQATADTTAKISELEARYAREVGVYRALVAGTSCPICHRPVTQDSLPEVQAALKAAAADIAEQRRQFQAQLKELQELDQKSANTFEQFKMDDLKKWAAEVLALEQQRRNQSNETAKQINDIRMEIQSLTADLEYGRLNQQEYDRLKACREELQMCMAEQAALEAASGKALPDFDGQIKEAKEQITQLERCIGNVALYVSKRAEMTFSQLAMNRVRISLYDVVKSTGECKDAFKFTYNGRRYDRISLSEKVRAGMEVSELMKRLTGRNYPVFLDNMESVDDLANVQPTGQVIMAKCLHNAELNITSPQQAQVPQAA